jgi:hypothetical protein
MYWPMVPTVHLRVLTLAGMVWLGLAPLLVAQSVGLPAPRLLTTMPMGGRAGAQVEVKVTGENLEDVEQLAFSDPRIAAISKPNAMGQPIPNEYIVTIAPDCPAGVYEARVMTRLGVSSSRAFSVGDLAEVNQKQPNSSLATAMELPLNSIGNAIASAKGIDHYVFEGRKGQRVIVDCATRGIDSKLDAVVVIGDAAGRDLLVERRGGALDFTVPDDGRYVIKVHDLTFKGGPAFFYRLGLWELPADAPLVRQPSTQPVNSFSWPPAGLSAQPAVSETEPNNLTAQAQKITLPCDLAGSFFPAADVDLFEFEAQQGEEWWVEVASERLGRPTDPAILVQRVGNTGVGETLTDVAELSDIPSPIKVSSNGYAYDGPPYNVGSSDILGKLTIQESGVHRLRLSDLFGGTRSDPRNIYRLVIRKAAPDFALVAWALHMELRNGDRNALSKPIALRGGSTIALEVVVARRDGFDGEIDFTMEGFPDGVTAQGLKIPAGQARGLILVTAHQEAPRSLANATIYGRAEIGGVTVTRPCRLASMAWPVPDSWGEIPSPRLLADMPVSVSGLEFAPITIAPSASGVHEVVEGEQLKIPLMLIRRSEFSGAAMQLMTAGAGFERAPAFDVSLTADTSQAVFDLATLKAPPGDYLIGLYGSAVAKYRHRPDLIAAAEEARSAAEQEVKALEAEAQKLAEESSTASAESLPGIQMVVEMIAARQKAAAAALAAAADQVKKANDAAQPKDIVDIVVSEPIAIRVKPAEKK